MINAERSDLEIFNRKNYKQIATIYAHATRNEFLQSILKEHDSSSKQESEAFHRVNSFMSISKPWNTADDMQIKSYFQPSESCDHSRSLSRRCQKYAGGGKTSSHSARHSSTVSVVESKAEKKKKIDRARNECESVNQLEAKNEIASASSDDQEYKTNNCCDDQLKNYLILSSSNKLIFPKANDFPKNALIMYWGRINMTLEELEHLNLSRCITELLEEDHYEFALLKMQHAQFILQFCNSHGFDSSNNSDSADENKPLIPQRRKSISEFLFHTEKIELCKKQMKTEKKPSGRAFLSCIGHFPSSSKNQYHLQHTDSMCLRSYDKLKRKESLKFKYESVIYCGAEERGIPNNMLAWIYHTEHDSHADVECFCVECDDQSHARHLSCGLRSELLRERE